MTKLWALENWVNGKIYSLLKAEDFEKGQKYSQVKGRILLLQEKLEELQGGSWKK